jgi:hypothetical protein
MLKKINKPTAKGLNIRNVEVQAYASPEGGFASTISSPTNVRMSPLKDYVNKQLKQTKLADTKLMRTTPLRTGTAFKKLVASNIQDKDVILRVLPCTKTPSSASSRYAI